MGKTGRPGQSTPRRPTQWARNPFHTEPLTQNDIKIEQDRDNIAKEREGTNENTLGFMEVLARAIRQDNGI